MSVKTSHFDELLYLFRCSGCGSLHFDDNVRIGNHDVLGDLFWQYYTEVGAGIEAMIRPLTALGHRARGGLLDVGCGFGYVPHFWTRSGRGDAVGVEQASYGRVGRDLLGAEIYATDVADCAAIAERQFDIVYASEVIEHVQQPHLLLDELADKLKPDGILVLTTPSADYVAPHRPAPHVVALLSPGLHRFLSSAHALRDMIREAGLPHCKIVDVNGRLMAWASRQPLPAISLDAFDWDEYFDYLAGLASHENRSVACGALYRLFKDSLNTGRTARAKLAYAALCQQASERYQSNPLDADPAAIVAVPTFKQRLEIAPAWLGGALLFGAVLNETEHGLPQQSCEMLASATLLLEHDARIGDQFTGEAAAFLPYAKTQYNKALQRAFSAEPVTHHAPHAAPRAPIGLCFFAHYDRDGRVADHVIHYLREIKAADFDVVFITTANPSRADLAKVAPLCVDIILRENIGHDFGSWAQAYRSHAVDPRRLLLLCNDSVYGPLWNLKAALRTLVGTEADFYGMVMSTEHVPHLQSWFVLFTPHAHRSTTFERLMTQRYEIHSKRDVIEKIEVRLTGILESSGLTSHALYDPRKLKSAPKIASNPSHYLWRQLIETYGVPFIKIELLRDNPMRLNLAAVPKVLRRRSKALAPEKMRKVFPYVRPQATPHVARLRRAPVLASRPQIYQALVEVDDFCGRHGRRHLQAANAIVVKFLRGADRLLTPAGHAISRFIAGS